MPVKNNYQIKLYHGNSRARIFNFPFRCFSLDDLVVEYIDVDGNVRELVQNTEYSVRGGLDNSGGMITYPLAPEELPLGPHEAIRISRCTPMSQEIDYPSYQQAIENALDKTAMIVQEAVGSNAIDIANEAVLAALEAVADVAEKVDRDGSNIDRLPFLSALKIGSSGEIDLSDLTLTDGSNMDVNAFVSRLGIDTLEEKFGIVTLHDKVSELETETESTILDLNSRVGVLETEANAIAPQTIVQGAVGDIPDGWLVGDCDNPAELLEVSTVGSATLIVKSGLQVCAGNSGSTLLSEILASDTSIDLNDKADGTHYIFADLNENGTYKEFVSDSHKPCVGQVISGEYEDELPAMTSDTTPEGYEVSSTPPARTAYPVSNTFNKEAGYGFIIDSSSGVVQVTFPERYIECYSVQAPYHSEPNRVMKRWTTEGQKPDGEWVVVDSVADQIGWVANETRFFNLAISGRYKGLRFNIASIVSGIYMEIQNIYLYSIRYPDFYNTSNHTHYDPDNNIIIRVYIGEVDIASGTITHVISYQHGTVVTLPVNDGANISKNSTYYLDIPYLGYCTSQARIYHEDKWGKTGWVYTGDGYGCGVRSSVLDDYISITTGDGYLTSKREQVGSDFIARPTSTTVPAKVTVERSW